MGSATDGNAGAGHSTISRLGAELEPSLFATTTAVCERVDETYLEPPSSVTFSPSMVITWVHTE